MTTSNTTNDLTTSVSIPGTGLLPWIRMALEGLWLSAAFLVPLIFFSQDQALSEARIAYVEVPKVALLRTLAGFMAILWLVEWAITSKMFQGSRKSISIKGIANKLLPPRIISGLITWIKVHPTQWLVLTAILFFIATFLSTVFSGSFTNSLWGEIPGQDGYSAYTIISYGILFSVIATHLKTQDQLNRLIVAIILMGFLVGLYATFQHYGQDFFHLREMTGGGTERATVFMGNAIFAAAVLTMTVPATLLAATINIRNGSWGISGHLSRLNQLGKDGICTTLWAIILAVQTLGLTFTFSRGAWAGTLLAMVIFLAFVVLSLGWRMLIRTSLVIGLSGVISIAFLHWQGSLSFINFGSWFGFVIAILGISGTLLILYITTKFNRATLYISIASGLIIILGVFVFATSVLSDLGSSNAVVTSVEDDTTTDQIGQRIASIKSSVTEGSLSGRLEHWEVSWALIKDRPWFEFDTLHFPWLRYLVGYGPDLFRYTYLLKSPAGDVDFLPLEPDHAHNFFIHQIVEQGVFGGIAILSLFVASFGIALHHLLRRIKNDDPVYGLLLFGLAAILIGRFFEMMVGVARVSDLTILWVLFGVFATLVRFDQTRKENLESHASQSRELTTPTSKRKQRNSTATHSFSNALWFRLAITAWLVTSIGVITWQKSINSVRASVAEGQAMEHFQDGNIETSIEYFDKAIRLAPGVPTYHSNRAQISLTYMLRPDTLTDPICAQQMDNPYLTCLGLQSLNANLEAVNQQEFNYRIRLQAANSAFNVGLYDHARSLYQAASVMAPNAYVGRNLLAEMQIIVGHYDDALEELNKSLNITGKSAESSRALYLKGKLLMEMEQHNDAIKNLTNSVLIDPSFDSLNLIGEIYTAKGVINDIKYFDKLINENADNSVAFYFRGLAYLGLGITDKAASDREAAIVLGLNIVQPENIAQRRDDLSTQATSKSRIAIINSSQIQPNDARYESALMILGQAYIDIEAWSQAVQSLTELISLSTDNATNYKKRGDALFALKRYPEALQDYELAISLDSNNSTNVVASGNVYAAIGEYETARSRFDRSIQINPNSSDSYASRGFIAVQTGDYSMGLPDIEHALELSPDNHDAYFKKAYVHIGLGQLSLALASLDKAIILAPINSEYYYSRGLVRSQLNDHDAASTDFTASIGLNTDLPTVNPRHAEPLVGRGMARLQLSNPIEALDDARKALGILEQQFDTPDWSYYKPTIDLQLLDVHLLLGDIYSDLNQPEKAKYEYEQASKYR